MRILRYVLALIALFLGSSQVFAIDYIDQTPPIYPREQSDVVQADDVENPLRDGVYDGVSPAPDWEPNNPNDQNFFEVLVKTFKITNSDDAQSQTVIFLSNLVNWFLSILGLVALVYLLYHGFMMVTAAGDNEKYDKGAKGVRFAAIALLGIGVSWIVIRFIFAVVGSWIAG